MVTEPIYLAIKALREELTRLDQVIAAVEAMNEGRQRRGRPPKFISDRRLAKAEKPQKHRRNGAKSHTRVVKP